MKNPSKVLPQVILITYYSSFLSRLCDSLTIDLIVSLRYSVDCGRVGIMGLFFNGVRKWLEFARNSIAKQNVRL